MGALTTQVIASGDGEAVRIPAEFRLNTDRVRISRNADGDLVIHPLPSGRGAAFLRALEGFDDSFVSALEADRLAPLPVQDRDGL